MKNIKFFKSIVLLLVPCMFFTFQSCEDLLDKEPITDLNPENDIKTETDLTYLVNTSYDPLQWQVINGGPTHMYPVMFQDIRADNCHSQWASYWKAGAPFDSLNMVLPNNSSVASLWKKWFTTISRTNTAIKYINQFEGEFSSDTMKGRLLGEAKFMRAFAYFELVKHFGDVPLILEVINSTEDNLIYTRESTEKIYAQIEKDLGEAAPGLWLKSQYSDNDKGRATRGAAYTLLAKVHLYQNEYPEVVKYTEMVMNLDYELETNFADNFNLANEYGVESIFEIGYVDGYYADYFENSTAVFNQGTSSLQFFGFLNHGFNLYGNSVPRQSLIETYKDSDTRLDATFIKPFTVLDGESVGDLSNFDENFWSNEEARKSRACMRKYNIPKATIANLLNKGSSPLNEKILRYADVLLMHAEASIMGGGGDGESSLQEVVLRAHNGELPADYEYTMKFIKEERRRELATEGWDRFTDLVRWGDAASVLVFKNFKSGRDELLPIPQSEINLVGEDILKQNPGY